MPSDEHNRQRVSKRRRLLSAGRRILRSAFAKAPPVPDEATARFVGPDGHLLAEVEAATGETLLRIARAHGVDISSYCGGQCSCGTCRVKVVGSDAGLSPKTPNEKMVLGEAQVRAGERLACQARLIGPTEVRVLDLF